MPDVKSMYVDVQCYTIILCLHLDHQTKRQSLALQEQCVGMCPPPLCPLCGYLLSCARTFLFHPRWQKLSTNEAIGAVH